MGGPVHNRLDGFASCHAVQLTLSEVIQILSRETLTMLGLTNDVVLLGFFKFLACRPAFPPRMLRCSDGETDNNTAELAEGAFAGCKRVNSFWGFFLVVDLRRIGKLSDAVPSADRHG